MRRILVTMWIFLCLVSLSGADQKRRLFILSGQSNMENLDETVSFNPEIKKLLPNDEVVIVKDAKGGKPISMWYRRPGSPSENDGMLYDRLMEKVREVSQGKRFDTITFVWMQGETDARNELGEIYAENLKGLIKQLQDDLGRTDLHVVIGRISDHDMENKKYHHWTMIRDIQTKVCDGNDRWGWVDSDDCNGPENGLHHTPEGYKILGIRFAQKSVELIKKNFSSN